MDLSLLALLVAGLGVLAGSLVQGTVGLGLGLVAAPALALVDPTLVPGTILLVGVVLPLLTAARERGDIDWRGLGFALVGRLPGTALGAWIVATQPPGATAVLVAVVVLAAVVLSVTRWDAQPTPRALLVAGAASGVAGTTTSVGGPPVALLYARGAAARLRSTLSVYFIVGAAMSSAALLLAGELGTREVARAAALLPFLLAGFLASGRLRGRVDEVRVRAGVLVVSAAGAVVLLARTLL